MPRYIDVDKAFDAIDEMIGQEDLNDYTRGLAAAGQRIMQPDLAYTGPTRAHWLTAISKDGQVCAKCSSCGKTIATIYSRTYKYCPYCGAHISCG